jgi:two-component system, cell cycle response regulator DivK
MRNWNVLVIEDEPDGREVLREMLARGSINVEAVGSAEQGIDLLHRHHYHAVIIDLMLPEMDGLQLIRMIRANPATARLPCIAVTAYHTSSVKKQALEMGFDGYFPKPLDRRTFIDEVRRLIGIV